jgi:hypothetical protein
LRRFAVNRRNTAFGLLRPTNVDIRPRTAEGQPMRGVNKAKAKASIIRGTEEIRLR